MIAESDSIMPGDFWEDADPIRVDLLKWTGFLRSRLEIVVVVFNQGWMYSVIGSESFTQVSLPHKANSIQRNLHHLPQDRKEVMFIYNRFTWRFDFSDFENVMRRRK